MRLIKIVTETDDQHETVLAIINERLVDAEEELEIDFPYSVRDCGECTEEEFMS